MAIVNNRPPRDVRRVLTGKDGCLYDGDGNLMATVESFRAQIAITNQNFQPLGSAQEMSTLLSFRVTIELDEIVVHTGELFRGILEGARNHAMPSYTLRGMVRSPYDGSEEQIIYRDCVPDGVIDIQNMAVGQLVRRKMRFVCNQPPEAQSFIAG